MSYFNAFGFDALNEDTRVALYSPTKQDLPEENPSAEIGWYEGGSLYLSSILP